MVNRPFIQSQKYKDQQMRALREGAHPDILEFEKRLVTRMRKQDVPLYCHCCVRSMDDQNAAFVQGHSKAKAGQSAHNYGMAIDVIHSVHGWNLQRLSWALLGHIGQEISVQSGIEITWGGEWKFYDPAHWELTSWRTLKNQLPK
ncbi:M15 family metallopeptidase [Mesorhizobium sp. M0563]|uniref:M15 family metallopeptidase n=1 Tax=Mesorhizobium sp. M0563 TaxID=2956959 RepID=UPI003335B440